MPNLLPDWLPWIHPAGRLIWSVIIFTVGIIFVFALMKPPVLKRPFPNAVGYSLFAIIPIVGWIIAGILPDTANIADWELDAIIVDLVLLILVAHALLMVVSREPKPADYKATWVECFLGGVAVFALMTLAYGVILQAVEIATAVALGLPALVREGLTWSDLRVQALSSSPVRLEPRPRRGEAGERIGV